MSNRRLQNRVQNIAKAALALAMCLIMSAGSLRAAAAQASEMPDPDRTGSISLTYTYYDKKTKETKPVSGGNSVGLFKVADISTEGGFKFVADQRFASAGEIPGTDEELEEQNAALAAKMAGLAKSYKFDVQPREMNAEGKVSFDGLKAGLYLVMQDAKGKDENAFELSPVLVSIPYRNPDGTLTYDVDAKSKPVTVQKITPPTPHKDRPVPPKRLPQTGQLWWPVIALAGAGAVMLCLGIVEKNRNK